MKFLLRSHVTDIQIIIRDHEEEIPMPLPFIVEMTSEQHGDIKGSETMYGKRNIILSYRFDHGVYVNTDQTTESSFDVRLHDPMTIYKDVDRSSPILAQHLVTGALLSRVALRFYKQDDLGKEVNYHTIHLENALITDISSEIRLAFFTDEDSFRDMESVSLSYQAIRWVDELESREAEDRTPLFDDADSGLTLAGASTALKPRLQEDFQLKFVDGDSREIMPGIKARINFPDGRFQDMASTRTGDMILTSVDKGTYTVSGFDGKPTGVYRGNVVAMVDVKKPSSKDSQSFKPSSNGSGNVTHICTIKEHTVKQGDLFSEVAKANGFTFEDLAFFNWGTRDKRTFPDQQLMRFECGDLAASGHEYILNEGVIYIPGPVTSKDIPTGTPYVAYVRRPGTRTVNAVVNTRAGNPVPNVTVTLVLADESTLTTQSDQDGQGLFTGVPEDLHATVTYDDEDDLVARHFAADVFALVQASDVERMLTALQSAVDYEAVKRVYQESYGSDVGEDVLSAFKGEDDEDVIELYLARAGLTGQGSFTHREEGGIS